MESSLKKKKKKSSKVRKASKKIKNHTLSIEATLSNESLEQQITDLIISKHRNIKKPIRMDTQYIEK